jgi:hypothetical protein
VEQPWQVRPFNWKVFCKVLGRFVEFFTLPNAFNEKYSLYFFIEVNSPNSLFVKKKLASKKPGVLNMDPTVWLDGARSPTPPPQKKKKYICKYKNWQKSVTFA